MPRRTRTMTPAALKQMADARASLARKREEKKRLVSAANAASAAAPPRPQVRPLTQPQILRELALPAALPPIPQVQPPPQSFEAMMRQEVRNKFVYRETKYANMIGVSSSSDPSADVYDDIDLPSKIKFYADALEDLFREKQIHGIYNISFIDSPPVKELENYKIDMSDKMKVKLKTIEINSHTPYTIIKIIGDIFGLQYVQGVIVVLTRIPLEKLPYPPVFDGEDNCALKVYNKYIPKGKNGNAVKKYFKNLNKEISTIGFTEDTAKQINDKYGYGCVMIDQSNRIAFEIPSRNKMKTISLQTYNQHVYEYKQPITAKYNPQRIEIAQWEFFYLAQSICEHGPQFVYRTDLSNTKEQYIAGIKTANIEYKLLDLPLGEFDVVDSLVNRLKSKYPHNFTNRDPAELSWIQLADFHIGTIWYDNPQLGYEIDFNQAYRSAAELKLSNYTRYKFPHWPTYWIKAGPESHDIIINNTGFAELADIDFSEVPEPLSGHMQKIYSQRIFTSPDIAYLDAAGVKYRICNIAYNPQNQNIDWGFVDPPDDSKTQSTRAKNINRVLMGRIITNPDKYTSKLLTSKAVTDYYRSAIGSDICHIDDSHTDYDIITYDKEITPKYNQQYHIHSYILAYLRIAMFDLLEGIDPSNIIKINIDAVHLKNKPEPDSLPFLVDNSAMGSLGAIKIIHTTTKGTNTSPIKIDQKVPELPFEDSNSHQLLLIGGAAGSGKTKYVSKQTGLTHIAAYQNKLAVALHNQIQKHEDKDIKSQTMHAMYGVSFADPKYTVTKVPQNHLHNLDDILLAPPILVKNIIKKLMKYGKRITATYGLGQATMDKPGSVDLIKWMKQKGFHENVLAGSERMDSDLYNISEKYRNDPRIKEIVELQREICPKLKIISKDIKEAIKSENDKRCTRLKKLFTRTRRPIDNLMEDILNDYKKYFKTVSPEEAIDDYCINARDSEIVVSMNRLKEAVNNTIKDITEVHKYRYNTHVSRKVVSAANAAGERYRRYNGEVVVTDADSIDAQLEHDILKGYCEHSHVYTVHSCQGETIEGNIYINIDCLFDPDIFYSAITRVRKMSNVILFTDYS